MRAIAPLAAALALAASQATALSCIEPDVRNTYQAAAESTQRFAILLGQVELSRPALIRGDTYIENPDDVPPDSIGQLAGGAIRADGTFSADSIIPVAYSVMCHGPWCGNLESRSTVLAFVRINDDDSLTLDVGPCNDWHFVDPSEEMLEQLSACVQGGACEPGQ